MKDRKLKHLTKLIQKEVGWFNGWSCCSDTEEKCCRLAAEKILKYLRVKEDDPEDKFEKPLKKEK